ncbi:MAG: hypothetical protein PHG87_02360 [Candidatus Omnitrophica bacterium]|nr:hypothetical protein [Candidatus Omnitrophota bacterium]
MEKVILVYLNLPLYFIPNNSGKIYESSSLDFLLLIKDFIYEPGRVKTVIAG